MIRLFCALLFFFAISAIQAATFGTVVPLVGGVVDIVLDQPRQRLYLVGVPDKIEIYSIPQRRFLAPIRTDSLPLSAALSRDGRFLYVACHNSATVNVINAETLAVTDRISLPARPEGIAVGGDGRVLITTIGTGPGNSQNTVLLYDPAGENRNVVALSVVPPTPLPPQLPPTAGRPILANRSYLATSEDGSYIIGVNIPNTGNRTVFVYEVASATIQRSRTVTNISSTLAVSPDGSKFMAGLTLFETETLTVLGQQNLANAPYPIAANTNFNTQQNQGGSVFSPDGKILYSAFNIAPIQNPAARPNVAQLQISDPENLLISTGLQMPENLSGKMLMTSDGANIFAISESGFVQLPMGQLSRSPIATPEKAALLLANDQCGVTATQRRTSIVVRNEGGGRLTANAQILTNTAAVGGLGGAGGAGGGQPGGGIVIVPPGGFIGGPGGIQIGLPIGQVGQPTGNQAVVNASPLVQNQNTAEGPTISFTYNSANRNLGSTSPTNFLIQSPEAVNIPSQVTVYQNNRNAEAEGDVIPIEVGISANEGLVDMTYDPVRRRVYIANSGKNRVEVYDERTRRLLEPIPVGQLPRSMALSLDNSQLYVASSSSEVIDIIDLDSRRKVGRVKYPPIPFNANLALIYPSVIAMTQRGLLVMMNNGTLWRVVGDELVPRSVSAIIGSSTLTAPRTMAATPNGEFAIVMAGNGFVYLYDALADDFVQARQIFSGGLLNGYYGPITAGPRGAYYIVNGTVLNQSLTPTVSAQTVIPGARPIDPPTTISTPIPAVAPIGGGQFARFSTPFRTNAAAVVTELSNVEIVNVDTGAVIRRTATIEGPVATLVGNARQVVNGRTMAVDSTGTTAYALTASGLSIVNLQPQVLTNRPTATTAGVVSTSSGLTDLAPGSLVSIFGRNLATSATASTPAANAPLPTLLGNVCVTMNNVPIPLIATSPDQINAQIPLELAPGTFPLVIRAVDRKLASTNVNVRVVRYAPGVIVDPETKQAAIFDSEGKPVNKDNPTTRDRRLTIFATGLGVTRGPRIASGQVTPASPEAVAGADVNVYFGDKRYREAEMIVEWAGLVPGFVGLYQIRIYVPGDRIRGDALDVTVQIGGVDSKQLATLKPTVAVN